MSSNSQTERVRTVFDGFAPWYDTAMRFFELALFGDGRRWACSLAMGDVLEVAIGTGRNLPFYPREVRVTGIELSVAMLEIARRRVAELHRQADLHVGDAELLPFANERFDTVVCTLSLCCVPDVPRAIGEMKRVLRPGGRLVLLDHVASDRGPVRAIQRMLEPFWCRFHADSLLRRPLNDAIAEGFEIEYHKRSRWGIVERVLARRPVLETQNKSS